MKTTTSQKHWHDIILEKEPVIVLFIKNSFISKRKEKHKKPIFIKKKR
jgi:hypothetical protein